MKGWLRKMLGDNIDITKDELDQIRGLQDFDLKMLLSEIHDHGWPTARKLLPMIIKSVMDENQGRDTH